MRFSILDTDDAEARRQNKLLLGKRNDEVVIVTGNESKGILIKSAPCSIAPLF